MQLIVEAPINPLSFGNVSYNFLREIHKTGMEIAFFPIGEPDFTSFQPTQDFVDWLNRGASRQFEALDANLPTLRLWHLNGSNFLRSRKQYLLTFYECNRPTDAERHIAGMQTQTFFSSQFAAKQFSFSDTFKLGFDEDFHPTNRKYLEGVTHFGLCGKFEKRKHTERIIRAWVKRYGNNDKYLLSCCITNPFFKPEQMNAVINNALEGKYYSNVNFIPWLKSNAEMNEFLNAIDIDLTGLSGGEGWNLPAFNATCLGKWSVVLNGTAHTEWANADNSILVQPNGEQDSDDGFFFSKGGPYNQGTFLTFSDEDLDAAFTTAESKVGELNNCGILLGQTFTYKKALEEILAKIIT